jgi:putative Ca2+/H+ antiporter (TMEM165/GDT1 family)
MATAVWWVVAVGAMVGMFAACVILVAAGVRVLENVLARRRQRQSE